MTTDKTPTPEELEALARKHGATSYRNRADTQHPAYGFTEDGLRSLLADALAKWGQPAQAGEPFGYFHQLLNHEGKGNGVWLGAAERKVVEQAHTPGETSEEIVALYTTPQPTQTQAAESVPAVDEVAEHYRNAIASACEGWTMPDGLRKHLETALWSPPTPPLTCEWTHNEDDGFWETACGEAWRFDDGGPGENNMHFCHSCGNSLRIKGGQHVS